MTRFHRLLPYVALATLAVAGVALVGLPSAAVRSGGVARRGRVEASIFPFSPATIEVDPGDRVTIELASADVVHGLHIEGYDVNLTADPGQPASANFIADRPGPFRIPCSVPRGPRAPPRLPFARSIPAPRGPQLAVQLTAMAGLLLVIAAGLLGTPVGSRNPATVLVWIAWWGGLVIVAVPFFGRLWCGVCPVPLPGEWLQRGALLRPRG